MDDQALLLVLRLVHIVGGVFWAGSMFLMAGFLLPAVRSSGQAGGQVMQRLAEGRRLPVYMGVSAGLTMLSGLWMYGIFASGGGAWAGSPQGITLGIGGLAAILAAIVGGSVAGRSGRKLAELGQSVQAAGGPPTPEQTAELQRLQNRMASAARAAAVLLVIAVAAMATARYI